MDIGPLLQQWRKARRLSQLALASEAAVSIRHLCFIETGRSSPSRGMVLRLAEVLDVPLRERNTLLLAAGFAPVYQESALDAPTLAAVRGALDTILAQQEPYPAVVMDRDWDIRMANGAATAFFAQLQAGHAAEAPGPPNVLRMMFHPDGVRPYVTNWPDVAEALVRRVRREAIGGAADARAQRILAEVLAYPGVPASLAPSTRPGRSCPSCRCTSPATVSASRSSPPSPRWARRRTSRSRSCGSSASSRPTIGPARRRTGCGAPPRARSTSGWRRPYTSRSAWACRWSTCCRPRRDTWRR